MENNSDKIYYYTSNYVLSQWLKNEKIWATRSISSNDALDSTYAIKYLEKIKENHPNYSKEFDMFREISNLSKNFSLRIYKDIVSEFIENNFEKYKELVQLNDNNIDLFKNILRELSEYEVKKYFNIDIDNFKGLIENLVSFSYPFIISFSYDKDNRFLWDSYTDNNGVCIEFNRNRLKEYLIKGEVKKRLFGGEIKKITPGSYIAFKDIAYDDNEQLEFIEERINKSDFSDIYRALSISTVICKSPFWKPENECRAIFAVRYFESDKIKIKENYNLKYNNGYKTQDYIEIPIPIELAESIIVGPMNTKEKLKSYLEEQLGEEIKDRKALEEIMKPFNFMFYGDKVVDSIGKEVIRK